MINMSKKLVSDLMVDYLERRGVEYVFGLCGHTVIGMLDALARSEKVKYISNRHEAVASTSSQPRWQRSYLHYPSKGCCTCTSSTPVAHWPSTRMPTLTYDTIWSRYSTAWFARTNRTIPIPSKEQTICRHMPKPS